MGRGHGPGPKPRDLVSADDKLEGTYFVRMFAEFETAIRSYWRTIRPKSRTPVEVVLDRLGDRLAVPAAVTREAQAVREYRNQLVHDRNQAMKPVTIKDARHWLATYLQISAHAVAVSLHKARSKLETDLQRLLSSEEH